MSTHFELKKYAFRVIHQRLLLGSTQVPLSFLYSVYNSVSSILETSYDDPVSEISFDVPVNHITKITSLHSFTQCYESQLKRTTLQNYDISLKTRSGGLEVKLSPLQTDDEALQFKSVQISVIPSKEGCAYTIQEAEQYATLRNHIKKVFGR